MVGPLTGTDAGRAEHSIGAGGDRTVELDRVAEEVVLRELASVAASGERFSVLSEEVGVVDHGAPFPLVLVDPVDGSLNAKQGVPMFAVMLALASGPTVDEVEVGYVRHLVTGQTWTAIKGAGAMRDGAPMKVLAHSGSGFEVIGLESSPRAAVRAQGLVERSAKIRMLGSMALSIALTASGGLEAFCAPFPVRVFDMAASVLLLSEAGGVSSDMTGIPLGPMRLGLDSRSTLLCAPTGALHRAALEALGVTT